VYVLLNDAYVNPDNVDTDYCNRHISTRYHTGSHADSNTNALGNANANTLGDAHNRDGIAGHIHNGNVAYNRPFPPASSDRPAYGCSKLTPKHSTFNVTHGIAIGVTPNRSSKSNTHDRCTFIGTDHCSSKCHAFCNANK
jgi:hypothetical protein